jgi:hypothetical protein
MNRALLPLGALVPTEHGERPDQEPAQVFR